ncbi:hypothetical protein [Croceivirga thetidis]|uniref:Uncharacterized protein n=1 Tax=Croceivirga thetidis TaxID=2721623 RepID=A0ABX1GUG2_9FLAO|nr:hypothetical protein [Croceivirga thetidis]NKI32565.1 hypothetical protein [Croceivirga thetidis]
MNLDRAHFEESLEGNLPPSNFNLHLKSLWFDAKGDWKKAHELVDQEVDSDSKWIHAYLHRKEGDEWNASYWYRQADRPFCKGALEMEFEQLLGYFCSK